MTKEIATAYLKLLLTKAEKGCRFFEAAALRMAITSLTKSPT